MMWQFVVSSLCFILFLGIAIFIARRKFDVAHPLKIFGLGLMLSDVFLVSGILDLKNGKLFSASVMTMAQLVTVNADYEGLIGGIGGGNIPVFMFLALCILTPLVLGSGLLLSFLENVNNTLIYKLYGKSVPVYFFSELHENSLFLAKDILAKHGGKCLCIFCNVGESVPLELREESKNLNCLLIKKSETACIKSPDRMQTFFEISGNQNANLSRAKKIIEGYVTNFDGADYSSVKIFIFSEQEETPLILSEGEKCGLPVIVVNRNKFIVNDLLFSKPLYNVLSQGERTVSVLIIGGGKTGRELLKTSVYCGQLGGGYKLKITLLDKNAMQIKSSLNLECPEFFCGEYDIDFIQADSDSVDFLEGVSKKCPSANYVCICLGNDELNIKMALNVSTYFRRIKNNLQKPFIAARIKDRTKNLMVASDPVLSKKIFAFGGDNLIYSKKIIDSELEELALNVHQIYMDGETDKKKILQDYYKNEYNIKSCRANALHLRYKLFLLGYDMRLQNSSDEETSDENLKISEEDIERLARVEHDRWVAYTRSEGWSKAKIEQFEKVGKNSAKIQDAKLHACLCSWEELDGVCAYFGMDFKKYDAEFVKNIPHILGISVRGENISSVRYKIENRN